MLEKMLILPIKEKWFRMILSGEKTEEYRAVKYYWMVRMQNLFCPPEKPTKSMANLQAYLQDTSNRNITKPVLFKNGYRKNAPSFIADCSLDIGTGNTKWGAKAGERYLILHIRSIRKETLCHIA